MIGTIVIDDDTSDRHLIVTGVVHVLVGAVLLAAGPFLIVPGFLLFGVYALLTTRDQPPSQWEAAMVAGWGRPCRCGCARMIRPEHLDCTDRHPRRT